MYDQTGGRISIYINGLEDNYVPSSVTSIQNTSIPLRIGQFVNSYAPSFRGSLDDFRLYNRSLSASEVLDLYNENPH